jgi:hypothetical protein
MDGTPLTLKTSEGGGACGVWVEQQGAARIEMTGQEGTRRKHE